MAMPDAVDAVLRLMAASKGELTSTVYNIGAFAPTVQQIETVVRRAFPLAEIRTAVDVKRQSIVDSWPSDVNDSAARRDWHHRPRFDFASAFEEYLIPNIRARYGQ
jgi:nucleoside-diphosphate-sugar epimerase